MITADGLGSAAVGFFSLMRGALHSFNPSSFIVQLHILSTFVKKVVANPNVNSRKLGRKDLQDICQRLIESCFMIAGKSFNAIAAAYPVSTVSAPQDREHTFSPIAVTNNSINSSGSTMRPISPSITPILTSSTDTEAEQVPSSPHASQTPLQSPTVSTSPTLPSQISPPDVPHSRTHSDPPTPTTQIPIPELHHSTSSRSLDLSSREQLKREASVMKSHVSRKALSQLAENMAPLLDVVFDDKERIVTLLVASLHHVMPYLRGRGAGTSPDHTFYAMSLLASISEFSYSLRAWRKDVMDIFTDAEFFKLETRTILKATKVVNQLMVLDRTAFNGTF